MLSSWPLRLLSSMLVTALLAGCSAAGIAVANLPALFAEREAGLRYMPGPRGTMDVYHVPAGASARVTKTRRPLVVFWYGGGFTGGAKSQYRFVGAALAGTGHVTVLPDYRVYPPARFPDFLQDAARAVVAAQREASRLGADPQRIVLAGHSAGAYIAAMLALQPRYLLEAGGDPAWIAGLIGLSGPYDIDPDTPVLDAIFTETATEDDFRPLRQVAAVSGRRAPPALLIHGEADTRVGVAHSIKLQQALMAAGDAVTLRLYPKRKHADTVAALSLVARRRAPVLAEIVIFLDSLDAPPRASASTP
ncbi:MAG: alpha/beta hydrolase [Pseudomonadota bacterium]